LVTCILWHRARRRIAALAEQQLRKRNSDWDDFRDRKANAARNSRRVAGCDRGSIFV